MGEWSQRILTFWLWGNRHKGGMTLIQAFIWNTRAPDFDAKRKDTSRQYLRGRNSKAKQEVGQCHSSVEASVMEVERRALVIQF